MKKLIAIISVFAMVFLCACGEKTGNTVTTSSPDDAEVTKEEKITFEQISQKEARELMETEKELFILDVRSEDEYNEGHIPGAVVIPHTDIEENKEKLPENKDELILVYCRSGRRSKIASEALVSLGYTNVKEFGGINTWEYETEK